MDRKKAIAIAVCVAFLMVTGVLLFVFQPQKPVPVRPVRTPGELVGVGIQIRSDSTASAVIIAQVVPNSPASEAGLTSGVIISKVDDESLAGKRLADCANLIRGPVGTRVKLELVTPDHSQTNSVELTRRKLQL
jgi:carboxyl-terminal processing protease